MVALVKQNEVLLMALIGDGGAQRTALDCIRVLGEERDRREDVEEHIELLLGALSAGPA